MKTSAESMERIVPGLLEDGDATGQATLALHLERYRWAADRTQPGRVLDLACGVGYGSQILADTGNDRWVVAADIAASALVEARRAFAHPRVSYVRGNGAGWGRPGSFRTIVSLETIEHVPDPERFLAELATLLAPGGILVASVPVTPSVDVNPHHRTDFTARSFLAMGRRSGLTPIESHLQIQPFNPIRVLSRHELRSRDLRPKLLRYYLSHPWSAFKRLGATLRFGFTNRYLTVAWQHSESR
jgi:SAM-dependent methyltransferase